MLTPDLELGRRFLAANPPPGEVLSCGVTGAHLYGFPSPDSDLDLKGVHLAPTESLLGLRRAPEAFDRLEVFERVECDYTSHEVGKTLALLLQGNANMLERVLSPIQLFASEEAAQLAVLAQGAVSRRFAGHYRGFFRRTCLPHDKDGAPRLKTVLYAYRVALTGVHLLRTGELVADLGTLAPAYGFHDVSDLIARKRAGAERGELLPGEDAAHRGRWAELEHALHEAERSSPLPEEPPNRGDCEAWLVGLRKSRL